MRFSETFDGLMKALAQAQGVMQNPGKAEIAKVTGQSKAGKPYEYTYRYADLADVLDVVRPALSGVGIALIQAPRIKENGFMILTTRLAYGAEWFEFDYPVCSTTADHQDIGSALTYAKRYSALAAAGIHPEREDDDGARAANPFQASRGYEEPPRGPENSVRDAPQGLAAPPGGRGARTPPPANISPPQKPKSKGASREDYKFLSASMRLAQSEAEMTAWAAANNARIDLLPKDWQDELANEYRTHRTGLRLKAERAMMAISTGEPRFDPAADDGPVPDEPIYDDDTGEYIDPESGEILRDEPSAIDLLRMGDMPSSYDRVRG